MNPAGLAMLVKGLKYVLDEHGFERARSDAGWLHNILADYSPQTPALNRAVATVAREGFADLLRRATTVGESDAVVGQAVSRLVSAHAFEQGAAYDAVTAWATVLGVAHTRQRPSSVMSASSVLGVGGRLERKIQRLLDEAEAAEGRGDWIEAVDRYDEVLTLDPEHCEALQLRGLAERRRAKSLPVIPSKLAPVAKQAPVASPLSEWSDASKVESPPDWVSSAGRAYAKSVGERGAQSKAVPPPNSPNATMVPTKPAVATPPLPGWRTAVMVDCGEDSFGRWAAVLIAGVEVRFRYCVPGWFLMGSPEREFMRGDDEGPTHKVELTHGFWMAEVPVTQRLWEAVARCNPSKFKGVDRPVEQVSWSDCDGWIRKANSMTGGLNLRFPTEAEWEYAARAGTTGSLYGELDAIAWHRGNSGAKTHEVKGKKANEWGLYDMIGNVWEWCSDWHGDYHTGRMTDPTGPSSGSNRVSCGGCWFSLEWSVRSADRGRRDPGYRSGSLGFRLVLSLTSPLPRWSDASKVVSPPDWLSNAGRAYAGLGERSAQSKAVPPSNSPNATTVPTKPAVVRSSLPGWRTAVMVDCGEDSFRRWAAVMIAGVQLRFRYCFPGRFLMGSPKSEIDRFDDEGPTHEVELTQGFWMAEVPVTQRLWQAVAGSNPSEFKGADRPVEQVSWSDCDGWIRKANSMTGGLNLRFPTEAEWEYAARAGTTGRRYGDLDAIAWHRGNSGDKTHDMKGKNPSIWGLHDMLGNVWEWCSDWHGKYPIGRVTDPIGPSSGSLRVRRGGSWFSHASVVRSAVRSGLAQGIRSNNLGFRPVLSLVQ